MPSSSPTARNGEPGNSWRRATGFTHALRGRGLAPGDGVAALLPNGADLVIMYLAAMQAGWYITPMNHHLVGAEVGHIVGDCEAEILLADACFAGAASEAASLAGLAPEQCFSTGGAIDVMTPLAALTSAASPDRPADLVAGGIMYYTSGTTGRPKGVCRALPGTHPDRTAGPFEDLLRLLGIDARSDDVHLCGSPMYHTAVLAFAADALHLGQTVVVMDRWTPASMLDLLERRRVTNTHMVPTQFHRLLGLDAAVREAADVTSLRYVVHGAAPCPPEEKRRIIEWWGPVVHEYYGTTEGGGTIVGPEDWLAHPGTVGRPWPGAEIRVLDTEGADVPAGEIGTVFIKVSDDDFEYYKDEAKTAAGRIPGYFTVGDIGYLDAEGYLYLCDRSSNLIISGGVNIYPAEIEAVLLAHGSVGDVAVFGIPDVEFGEQVHAVVEPAEGIVWDDSLRDELVAHCRQRLAGFKVPRSWDETSQLPRDPSGKLFTRTLRDPYWPRTPES